MVKAAGGAHHGGDAKAAVLHHPGPLFARADRHDHALRRVDDGLKVLDAHHPHVRQAGGAALIFGRLQLAFLGLGGERAHVGGNLRDALAGGVLNDRGDQAARNADRHADVGAAKLAQSIPGKGDIARRHLHQSHTQRLDQQIVDRQLHPAPRQRRVQLPAKGQQRIQTHIHREVNMRHGLL